MPYLQLEFEAKRKMPACARASGLSVGELCWGLLEAWEYCWEHKTDSVGGPALCGFFGSADLPRLSSGLSAFDFIEDLGQGSYRIRGASRYLRISQQRSEAGKKGAAAKWDSMANDGKTVAIATRGYGPFAKQLLSEDMALTPNTDHRSPNKEDTLVVSEAKRPPSPNDLAALWNEKASALLPRWKAMSKARAAKARIRLAERPNLEEWTEVIRKLNDSPFCLGDSDRGWRASPDWLLQPDTAGKVLEGKYDRVAKNGRIGESSQASWVNDKPFSEWTDEEIAKGRPS